MRFDRFALITAGFVAGLLPLAGASSARAEDLITRVPTVHVASPGLASQAQLAAQLRAQGYTDVILSSVYPSPADPYPWRNPSLTSHPEQTPVHGGWNGVASKGGQVFQVYADQ